MNIKENKTSKMVICELFDIPYDPSKDHEFFEWFKMNKNNPLAIKLMNDCFSSNTSNFMMNPRILTEEEKAFHRIHG